MIEHAYFGTGDRDLGHFWWVGQVRRGRLQDDDVPWPAWEADGELQPRDPTQPQGLCKLHERDGWTCIAWWDRTRDTRPSSCSVFAAKGRHTFEEMCELLRQFYPNVAERQTEPLRIKKTAT